jgi:hypothetical protein
MKSLKLGISSALVVCGTIYSVGCFAFYKQTNTVLDQVLTNESICTNVDRGQFSINPFLFKINFLDEELKEKKMSFCLNPFTNSIKFYIYKKIEGTFNIPDVGCIEASFTPIKGNNFAFLKLNKSPFLFDFNKSPLQMVTDQDIVFDDFYDNNLGIKVDFKANYINENIGLYLPKQFSLEADVKEVNVSTKNGITEKKFDYTYKSIKDNVIEESANKGFIDLSIPDLLKIAQIYLSAENKEKIKDEDKETIISSLHHFIKTFKFKIESDSKASLQSDQGNISPFMESKGELAFDGTESGKIKFDIPNFNIKTSLPQLIALLIKTGEIPADFLSTLNELKKITEDFSNFSLTIGSNIAITEKDNPSAMTDVTLFKDAIKNLKTNEKYHLSCAFNLAIDDSFKTKIIIDYHHNEDVPSHIKVVLPKKSYDSFVEFLEKINTSAHDMSIKESISTLLLTLKAIPYEQLFKCEKDPITAEDTEIFTFPLGT